MKLIQLQKFKISDVHVIYSDIRNCMLKALGTAGNFFSKANVIKKFIYVR